MGTSKAKPRDSIQIWLDIYRHCGETGLLEFSRLHHNPSRGLGQSIEEAHLYRLAGVASEYPLSDIEFYQIAQRLPKFLVCMLVGNPACPESLIEDLWVGDYVNILGQPDPTAVVCSAFYNNHFKLTSIYSRRPDLRTHVKEYMRNMIESSLSRDRKALLDAS